VAGGVAVVAGIEGCDWLLLLLLLLVVVVVIVV
jgi:hypothetical protein